MAKKKVPANPDGLWRIYTGSHKYHRYAALQLRSAYEHQVALCGFETRTGNGSYSVMGPNPTAAICRKCELFGVALKRREAAATADVIKPLGILPYDHPERILARLLNCLHERVSCRVGYTGAEIPTTDFEAAWHEAWKWYRDRR